MKKTLLIILLINR